MVNYSFDILTHFVSLFHSLLVAVGHGIDPETQEPYFLVKNSWGEKWGDKG